MRIENSYDATASQDFYQNATVKIIDNIAYPYEYADFGLNVKQYAVIYPCKQGERAILAGDDTVFHIQE